MLTRVITDVKHEEDLTERQMQMLADATADFVKAVGMADLEVTIVPGDRTKHAHVHVSTEERRCRICAHFSADEQS